MQLLFHRSEPIVFLMATAQTQSSDQAAISYIEHYLDVAENLPNNVARILTRIHELDIRRTRLAKRLDDSLQKFLERKNSFSVVEKEKHLNNLYPLLVQLQGFSDSKISLFQSVYDHVDLKVRQLESQSRSSNSSLSISQQHSSSTSNLTANSFAKTNGNIASESVRTSTSSTNLNSNQSANVARSEPKNQENGTYSNTKESGTINNNNSNSSKKEENKENPKEFSSNQSNGGNGKRTSRRSNGTKKDQDSNGGSGDERSLTPVTIERTASSSSKRVTKRSLKSTHKESKDGGNKNEAKRRKNSYNYNESPTDDILSHVDPNEPTYCLCEQVSYGEMICCDNPGCKIEWFHFVCVSLTAIPKGRWYCPNCRGERSNIQRK